MCKLKRDISVKLKLLVPSIRRGITGEQTASIKFPVHMRVRVVHMDQKEWVILYQKERATKA